MINSWGNPSLNICVYFARVQWLSWQELCVFLLWTLLWMFILKLFIQLCVSAIFSWRMCFNNYNLGGINRRKFPHFQKTYIKDKKYEQKEKHTTSLFAYFERICKELSRVLLTFWVTLLMKKTPPIPLCTLYNQAGVGGMSVSFWSIKKMLENLQMDFS